MMISVYSTHQARKAGQAPDPLRTSERVPPSSEKQEYNNMIDLEFTKIKDKPTLRSYPGAWRYDAHPELEALDAGKTIPIAHIAGPAVIQKIHISHTFLPGEASLSNEEKNRLIMRGIVLKIHFDDQPQPAVCTPLGDFFCSGAGAGKKEDYFSSFHIDNQPMAFTCRFPMPFKQSARITLTNETGQDLRISCLTEATPLEAWDEELGYFHATWKRFAFQLHNNSDLPFFHIDGCGHYIGCAWSICTDEPLFNNFRYVMEGSHEIRVDGESAPAVEYLGTEEIFGVAWGYQKEFQALFNGINHLHNETPSMLSAYTFRHHNPIRFRRSFDLRTNWRPDWNNRDEFQKDLKTVHDNGRGWVDYATTYYWYQQSVGHDHEPLPPLQERIKPILHENPQTKIDLSYNKLH